MEMDLLDSLAAVGLFVAGGFVERLRRRADARVAAGLKLSELRRHVWPGDDRQNWIELQTCLSQLRVELRAARVPRRLVEFLSSAAIMHFRTAEWSGEVEAWLPNDEASDQLDAAEIWILDWLDGPLHVIARVRALRGVRRPLPEERVHRFERC